MTPYKVTETPGMRTLIQSGKWQIASPKKAECVRDLNLRMTGHSFHKESFMTFHLSGMAKTRIHKWSHT